MDCDSGLQHQAQLSGHPLRNTVVWIPGPSCRVKRSMLKMKPLSSLMAKLEYGIMSPMPFYHALLPPQVDIFVGIDSNSLYMAVGKFQ